MEDRGGAYRALVEGSEGKNYLEDLAQKEWCY